MEVHHHSHSARAKWTHYFWEFLMLFLAVFAGFLAEYQLEHTIEKQREKELARALYAELLDDSVSVANKIQMRLEKEKDMDYLSNYFKDSSLTSVPHEFYPILTTGMYLINIYQFDPKDGMLNQLRNSGSLRYFKNMKLQKLIGDIGVSINDVRVRNEQEFQYFSEPVKPFLTRHYDFSWLDRLRTEYNQLKLIDVIKDFRNKKLDIPYEGRLLNISSINKEEVSNMIIFYKQVLVSTRILTLRNYVTANDQLLSELRNNYTLE